MDLNIKQPSEVLEKLPSSQKEFPKVIALGFFGIFILLVIGGMIIYIFLGKPEVKKETATTKSPVDSGVELTTEYSNPFDATASAENPFSSITTEEEIDNPFDNLSQ